MHKSVIDLKFEQFETDKPKSDNVLLCAVCAEAENEKVRWVTLKG